MLQCRKNSEIFLKCLKCYKQIYFSKFSKNNFGEFQILNIKLFKKLNFQHYKKGLETIMLKISNENKTS